MSTDQLTQRRASQSRSDVKLVHYDAYIDAQVESTRRLVKIVDLAGALVVLAAGVVTYLLVAAVAEHWLVPSGFPVAIRLILFMLLAGGVAYFAYHRLWPLATGKINPVYAAQAIEVAAAGGRSLKNSLVNLLLFRQKRSGISDAVYQTLEEQAAQGLSRVPVDSAVDRSQLIRFGYLLLAVVAVALGYKVLSPKDPFVSAQRVLLPWADIVPASRVTIREVEPGSVTLSRGEFLEVSAEVRGIGENDPVHVRFTTEDGRAVDRPVAMRPSKDGLRFEARLPDRDDPVGELGVGESFRYRIEAGDARSLDFDVTVVSAPSILVERIDYDYPAYTGYSDRQVERLGDIRAIEGTRVTIHARANGPIREAHLDFDADGRNDLRMTSNETTARASFELKLREDRLTPQHASYVLRFVNRDGRTNRDPVKSSIHVEPDIGPEAHIRLPKELELTVRVDETIAIEAEAIDPDFGLAEVWLRGEVAGRKVLNEPLLSGSHSGRFSGRYRFRPESHGLRAGDVMQYWVTASDRRMPDPNEANSKHQTMIIASPDPAQQPPPDRREERDARQRGQDGRPGNEQPQDGESQEGADGQEGQGKSQQPPQANQGDGQRETGQQPQGGQQDRSSQGEEAEGGESSRQAEQERHQGDDTESGGQPGQSASEQPADENRSDAHQDRGEQGSDGQPTGGGAEEGEASAEGGQPNGARQPDAGSSRSRPNDGNRSGSGERQSGSEPQAGGAEQSPVSTDGDNDAEAFERIRNHLRRDGEMPEVDGDSTGEPSDSSGEASQQGGETRGEPKERGAQERPTPADEPTGADPSQDGTRGEGNQSQDGERGESAGAMEDEDSTGSSDTSQESQDEAGSSSGDESAPQGAAGAGEEEQPQGAPNSQPDMKPGMQKREAPAEDDPTDSTEPPAGGRGKKESDSQGEQGGDRAGGGEEGGGQDAPRDGTGSAGQHQAADEGAGESTEPGGDATGTKGGKDQPAGDRTGQPGDSMPGTGSGEQQGQGQERGGESSADDRPQGPDGVEHGTEQGKRGDGSEQERPGETAGERGGEESQGRDAGDASRMGRPTGSGGERGARGEPGSSDAAAPEGDEANLEYARKQTDLVLEKLADQLDKKKVDDELLEDLGWSEDDLRRFVERWQARKEAAQREDSQGDSARRELDEALRSLGLRPGPLRQGPLQKDSLRDLREGYRGTIPLEYQERLRAYNRGVSRARSGDESR